MALAKPDLQSAADAVPGVALSGTATSVPPMATITQLMSGVSNDSFTEIVGGSKEGNVVGLHTTTSSPQRRVSGIVMGRPGGF